MKFTLPILALFATSVIAAPTAEIEKRQSSTTSNDYKEGGCKKVVMLYARASTEAGNIGSSVGPELKTHLSAAYPGNFAMQGIDYPATLADNFLSGGTSEEAKTTMANLITDVASKCPSAAIIVGGYSQGTAVTARGIEKLSSTIKARINAVVVFGYTQNQQLNGGVPGISQDRVKVYCALGDLVCSGTLTITAAHFTYTGADTRNAAAFIQTKVSV